MNKVSGFLFILLLFPGCLYCQKKSVYEKNLNVIRDISVYHQTINQNSNNKLVEINKYIPDIILDIRYATSNNFTGMQIYNQPKAFTRLPVVKALKHVQKELKQTGLGLIIYDAYRPYTATVKFYEVYHDTNYVASPYSGSRHNRGAAVDISLVDLKTGKGLEMPTPFDDFTEKAHPDYTDLPAQVIKNRQLLIDIMKRNGFTVYPSEWWHYDFNGWENFEIMDLTFEQLTE
ncbi:MAG: D-alanyl-D-alanine dipeptidase [Bacteroidetes bacterium]|nr:MAG: D-alanyl-D-alanine dipeptidase [Bacteroidota bacterium]